MLFETRENKQNSGTLKQSPALCRLTPLKEGVVCREWGYKINYVLP